MTPDGMIRSQADAYCLPVSYVMVPSAREPICSNLNKYTNMNDFTKLSVIALSILLVVTLSAGGVILVRSIDRSSDSPGVEIVLPQPSPSPSNLVSDTPAAALPAVIKVYVSGGVAAPGVYEMVPGDRVLDVITEAGGPVEGAQLSCINLASAVTDGAQYHVPTVGDECVPKSSSVAAASATVATAQDGKIDLNSASAEELQGLPGIGEVKSNSIVSYRDEVGPFLSVEQVVEVRGIGLATMNAIYDLVYVGSDSE